MCKGSYVALSCTVRAMTYVRINEVAADNIAKPITAESSAATTAWAEM